MLRREFIRGSAVVGAAVATPSWLTAASGFFAAASERKVAQVLNCKRTMVQNVPVLRAFAGDHTDLVSPFVMLDEFGPLQIDPGTLGMDIKAHPHAGVAPTTYLLSGSGRHTDSLKNDLIYREGQFMVFSSGRGAIHEEVSSMEIRRDGGVVHGFQIWLNLPASEKFGTPITTLRDRTDFPVIEREEYRIKVLMGEVFGQAAPTETHSPAFYHHIHIAPGGRLDLPVDPTHNAFVHVVEGNLEVEGRRELQAQQLALYQRGGDHLRFHSIGGAECIVLGGQPLNEPVVSYGPFVMNDRSRIQRCIADYRAGRMGSCKGQGSTQGLGFPTMGVSPKRMLSGRGPLPKFAPHKPPRLNTTTQHTIHTFTMKQLFALFAVALLFAAPVSAQDADTTMDMSADTTMMVADSMMTDSAMMDSAAAPAEALMAEEAPAMPEETVEVTGARQQIKLRIIEGGVLFMSFVVLCLIFGLALAIERIIYLNMATTNTKGLLTKVEDAMNSGGVEAAKAVCADTRGPVAAIFHQGLDRSGGSYEELAKAVEDYGSLESTKLERGLSWISLFIALAPMLGFMGTVIGMIEAFDKIAQANTINASIVAGGIKVALITTVSGLVVAIILQIFYNYILSKIDGIVFDMEEASMDLVDLVYRKKLNG